MNNGAPFQPPYAGGPPAGQPGQAGPYNQGLTYSTQFDNPAQAFGVPAAGGNAHQDVRRNQI